MTLTEREKDNRRKALQRYENRVAAAVLKILKAIFEEVNIVSDAPRSVCHLCGCLLFPSDDTCPGCRSNLILEQLHGEQDVYLQTLQVQGHEQDRPPSEARGTARTSLPT